MSQEKISNAPHCHCFRCKLGCLHVVWDNVMLSFTREQFLIFAEAIGEMNGRILQDDGTGMPTGNSCSGQLLM